MAPYLWFLLGCCVGSVVFGLLAWAEQMKNKRFASIMLNSMKEQKELYDQSVNNLAESYEVSTKKMHQTYGDRIKELTFILEARADNNGNVKALASKDLN